LGKDACVPALVPGYPNTRALASVSGKSKAVPSTANTVRLILKLCCK
jgi:hypothetical protein